MDPGSLPLGWQGTQASAGPCPKGLGGQDRLPGTKTQPVPGPPEPAESRRSPSSGLPRVLWLLPEGEACVLSREVQGRPREPWELAWVRKLIVKPERSVVKFIPSSAPAPAQGWGGAGPPAVAAARGGPRALSDGTRPFSQLSGAALAGQPRPGGQGLRRPQGPASPPAHQAGRQRT